MQTEIDKAVLASRHLLTVFLLGLAGALALYALRFVWKLGKFTTALLSDGDADILLGLLYLLDSALIATLVVMVVISTYDGLVSPVSEEAPTGVKISWIAKLDPGNLKIKLAGSIVAISSIHLLQIFMQTGTHSDRDIFWAVTIHTVFVLSALMLAVMDRISAGAKALGKKPEK